MNAEGTGMPKYCDVLVIGSGAGGMMAANRAHDRGLDTIVIERTDLFGGTSALSGGGVWIPCNHDIKDRDSRDDALTYLRACTKGHVAEAKLCAFVDSASEMMDYLHAKVAVPCHKVPGLADYNQSLPGACEDGRTMFPEPFDAAELGDTLFQLRPPGFSGLFDRINLSFADVQILGAKASGWKRHFIKLVLSYWLDLPWRRKTRMDRRLTMGGALVAGLRAGLKRRAVPVILNTRFREFIVQDGRVVGAVVEKDGTAHNVIARRGVIAGSGGFEQNQALRDQFLPVPTQVSWSVTPANVNVGDALVAGVDIGAATDLTEFAWWAPTIRIPARETPNIDTRVALFADRSYPHSLCVNRNGDRFANEAMSYHEFGFAMMEDDKETNANIPCWMIFDGQYRAKSVIGSIMPSSIMPDNSLPPQWWDNVLYRADTLAELSGKIGILAEKLTATVDRFNGFARVGVDQDFERGRHSYDAFYCDKSHVPNPTLGELSKAPYYAVRVDLGDIGTTGGLKTDEHGRVLDTANEPIMGLYAIGNCSGGVTGGSYPGAGGTLGPAMTFGFRAADHIAENAESSAPQLRQMVS